MAPTNDLLHRLARVNPTRAFLGALVLMLAGLFLPGIIGAAALFLLGAALAALTVITWPVQPPPTRLIRIVMLIVLFALVIFKVL